MCDTENKSVKETEFQDLKNRMRLIADVDPDQYHNDFSLKRYLRAFATPDDAFKVIWKLRNIITVFCSYLGNLKDKQMA